jgi:predicted DNA-binding transcriptional regulator AlpA
MLRNSSDTRRAPGLSQTALDASLLLNPREAARALSISERSLFELTKSGEIPSIVVCKKLRRYSVIELQQWIDTAHQQQSDQQPTKTKHNSEM